MKTKYQPSHWFQRLKVLLFDTFFRLTQTRKFSFNKPISRCTSDRSKHIIQPRNKILPRHHEDTTTKRSSGRHSSNRYWTYKEARINERASIYEVAKRYNVSYSSAQEEMKYDGTCNAKLQAREWRGRRQRFQPSKKLIADDAREIERNTTP